MRDVTARPSHTTKIVESNESQKRTHVSMATTAVGVAARARGGPSAACVGTGSQNDAAAPAGTPDRLPAPSPTRRWPQIGR